MGGAVGVLTGFNGVIDVQEVRGSTGGRAADADPVVASAAFGSPVVGGPCFVGQAAVGEDLMEFVGADYIADLAAEVSGEFGVI